MSDVMCMKKIYRQSQMGKVLGRSLSGRHMHKYGLKYSNPGGFFGEFFGEDASVDLMLSVIEKHSTVLHAVSFLENGWIVNRYDPQGRSFLIFEGNDDPNIEFSTEFRLEDFSQECIDEMLKHDFIFEQIIKTA